MCGWSLTPHVSNLVGYCHYWLLTKELVLFNPKTCSLSMVYGLTSSFHTYLSNIASLLIGFWLVILITTFFPHTWDASNFFLICYPYH